LATPKQGEVVLQSVQIRSICVFRVLLKNGDETDSTEGQETTLNFFRKGETLHTLRSVRAKHFSPLHTPTSVPNPFNLCRPRSLEKWNTDETDSTDYHRFLSSKNPCQICSIRVLRVRFSFALFDNPSGLIQPDFYALAEKVGIEFFLLRKVVIGKRNRLDVIEHEARERNGAE
jgi:hypothetical protein